MAAPHPRVDRFMQNLSSFRAAALRRPLCLFLTLLAMDCAVADGAAAAECSREAAHGRPAVGLVLGGGGARGYAHIGVLKFLEEMRIPVDYVAGTSMGSIVGAFTATGMTADDIRAVVETIEWAELFQDEAEREDQSIRRKSDDRLSLFGPKFGVGTGDSVLPSGVLAGQRILFKFENLTSQRVQADHFDQLPIPYRAVATDIVTGEPVVLNDGSLANAMRASMAVPGVFDPVSRGDRLLVDGGLSRNLPVDVVRAMGAEVVIAVDVGTPLMGSEDIRNVLSIIEQMSALMVVRNTREQIAALGEDDGFSRRHCSVAKRWPGWRWTRPATRRGALPWNPAKRGRPRCSSCASRLVRVFPTRCCRN
ncbi:MAG: patatin-like phospholipase family protein [Gammaproteobacteria bacterium]